MGLNKLSLKGQALVNISITSLILVVMAVATIMAIKPIHEDWSSYQQSVGQRLLLVSRIGHQVGYGGAIHSFKNYVLRGDGKYLSKFQENHRQLQASLLAYRSLPDITQQERNAIADIESVFKDYRDYIGQAETMIAAGHSPAEIDKVVKIDDGPALNALKV